MKKTNKLSPREEASFGPRHLKDPSSTAFAWQTISLLKTRYQSKTISEKNWRETLEEVEKYRVYERVPEDRPYGSLDAMLQAEIGVTAEESVEAVNARHQASMKTALENKEPQPTLSEAMKDNQNASKTALTESENVSADSEYGNASSYRIRKLRRDFPESAERLERGEFKSVAAAERWAKGEEPHPAYPKKTAPRSGYRGVKRI